MKNHYYYIFSILLFTLLMSGCTVNKQLIADDNPVSENTKEDVYLFDDVVDEEQVDSENKPATEYKTEKQFRGGYITVGTVNGEVNNYYSPENYYSTEDFTGALIAFGATNSFFSLELSAGEAHTSYIAVGFKLTPLIVDKYNFSPWVGYDIYGYEWSIGGDTGCSSTSYGIDIKLSEKVLLRIADSKSCSYTVVRGVPLWPLFKGTIERDVDFFTAGLVFRFGTYQ